MKPLPILCLALLLMGCHQPIAGDASNHNDDLQSFTFQNVPHCGETIVDGKDCWTLNNETSPTNWQFKNADWDHNVTLFFRGKHQ